MVKKNLMLGAAFAALSLIPMTSQVLAEEVDLDIEADWEQDLNVELEWNVDVDKYLDIDGDISIDGSVVADALAHATLKDDQIIDSNDVYFEDYQNANSNSDEGNLAEPGLGTNPVEASEEGSPYPATYNNSVVGNFSASAVSGNIGINLASGDYNMQENAAVIASAEALAIVVDESTGAQLYGGGAAEAGSFSLQNLYDNDFNGILEEQSSADSDVWTSLSPEWENLQENNSVDISGTLNASTGNIGLNAAAGAFNIQKNALVIATVTGGNLAEAVSGVLQDTQKNDSIHETVSNSVNLSSALSGSTGNIGVNLAAGVGNLQLNTLTIANALGGETAPLPPAAPPPAPPTGGGGPQ